MAKYITSVFNLVSRQQWNFPLGIWHLAITSTLVAVASLSKWKPDQTS